MNSNQCTSGMMSYEYDDVYDNYTGSYVVTPDPEITVTRTSFNSGMSTLSDVIEVESQDQKRFSRSEYISVNQLDVELVMVQCNVSEKDAINALMRSNNDIVEAIMSLTSEEHNVVSEEHNDVYDDDQRLLSLFDKLNKNLTTGEFSSIRGVSMVCDDNQKPIVRIRFETTDSNFASQMDDVKRQYHDDLQFIDFMEVTKFLFENRANETDAYGESQKIVVDPRLYQKDIDLIMRHANVTEEKAIEALISCDQDVVEAIMRLTES